MTPLHYAVISEAMPCLRVLLDSGARADLPHRPGGISPGETPLHMAVRRGFVECARILINYGADVNACGTNNATPLHVATGCGHQAVVNLLASKGELFII